MTAPKQAPCWITFHGAADTVTGSRALVEYGGGTILVDCGLFQGIKKLRERNWKPPGFDVASIDAVVLTHAHIDHSGYLPRLCKLGYSGPVFCTRGTADLLSILLPDSAHLHEEDARRANRYGYTKHRPASPLYTGEDAARALDMLVPVEFEESIVVAPDASARFLRAGHILGAACVELSFPDLRVTFTGDVGRPNDPIMEAPQCLGNTDVLVTESTYGDRRHPVADDLSKVISDLVMKTVGRGGDLLVPSFAVGRAQQLLHVVAELVARKRIPDLPIFLDSPMAIRATRVFLAHPDGHRLTPDECVRMFQAARCTQTTDESKAIAAARGSKIIISASGMATGGRVLHHLARLLPDERNSVLFVGFQAAGTRGRALVEGAKEIKIHGRYVPVAAEIVRVDVLSAHADYGELLDWLRASEVEPSRVFVTHGEPAAADALRRRLVEEFGWRVNVPNLGQKFVLG